MSSLLWKYFFEDDVDNFRQVLARATYNASAQNIKGGGKGSNLGVASSPGAILATPPTLTSKSPKSNWNTSRAPIPSITPKSLTSVTLSRADINWKDSNGVTLLHHIASSNSENASHFALALLQLPLLDLYIQDEESGWTTLHRALYFGNITIARALMDRDIQDATEHSNVGALHSVGGLIKIKDREGNSPFDVYGASITSRNIRQEAGIPLLTGVYDEEDNDVAQGVTGDIDEDDGPRRIVAPKVMIDGDDTYAFGSNKNFTLGFGDEDDRQFPERICLKRPDHLLRHFLEEYEARNTQRKGSQLSEGPRLSFDKNRLPAAVQYRQIVIQDVQLSKMHSAVLTTDPKANLYMCGFGSGGRLGTGDETTRFSFVNIHGGGLMGKKVVHLGLGQHHSIAISSEGETFTWGNNAYGQLGYAPNTLGPKDEESLQLLPRQVFGPLKRELVLGAAASRIHSVVHTATSLFTFGKNEGQLGLVDSDARSLLVQNTPRKVAASLFPSPIISVSAIDKATICLLDNHDVWVFFHYGYTKLSFPLDGFSNYFVKSIWGPRSSSTGNEICRITSGGDTICAMSSMGDVFTIHVTQKVDSSTTSVSTTNPSKIRGALAAPQRVWSLKKSHMAVRDVDIGQDGSIIICTESGSVWRRVKRMKIKDASSASTSGYKAKDYKFSRVPGLTRITAVRSNAFGSYAAVRQDFDVLKTQIDIESNTLWKDMYPLLPFHGFADEDSDTENPIPRFWTSSQNNDVAAIRRAVLTLSDFEEQVLNFLNDQESAKRSTCNIHISTTSSDVRIPVHDFLLGARSEVLRQALLTFGKEYFFTISEVLTIEYDSEGKPLIIFQGVDFITIFNFVLYLYTDSVVDVWHHTRHAPALAFRYRQIRTELMKIASHVDMPKLEQAVRVMQEPPKTLDKDLTIAIRQSDFFDNGDVEVELDGENVRVHSALVVQRCPFFEGLFEGRSAGLWLSSRREESQDQRDVVRVDMKHVEPEVFQYIVRHLYADTDEETFDHVIAPDLDTFLDLVLDVMSVANELMLDRLSQCCQKVLGRHVDIRNVCQLLNAVAPCSVTQFKDAALEYICLNLEGMLENKLLGELDEDLMLELDEVVRQNQLACLPIAKSGRADIELLEMYPELAGLIERGKCIKVDSVSLQTRLHEREAKSVGGSKAKATFLDDFDQSPSAQKGKSKHSRDHDTTSKNPSLKPKRSAADLMFVMEEDEGASHLSVERATPTRQRPIPMTASSDHRLPISVPQDSISGSLEQRKSARDSNSMFAATFPSSYEPPVSGIENSPNQLSCVTPWASPSMTKSKLDLKDIMAQASPSRTSNLSAGLALSARGTDISSPGLPARLSQRERKKQQQQQFSSPKAQLPTTPTPEDDREDEKSSSPWQIASSGPRVSLKDVIGERRASSSPLNTGSKARTPSPMTLRQTVSGKPPPARRAVTGPAQPPATVPKRTVSTPSEPPYLTSQPTQRSSSSSSKQPHTIQSIRHVAPPVEPTLQLSMADILSQQQTEKEIIKEAAAKRSLQEIQEEQAFQEWWDEESRKAKAEVEEAAAKPTSRGGQGLKQGRGPRGKSRGASRGRGRGRGGTDSGDPESTGAGASANTGGEGGKKGAHRELRGKPTE